MAKFLPGVVHPESDDADGNEAGCTTEQTDVRCETIYFTNYLVLFGLFVGVGAVEEELVFFVAGDLGAVGKQEQEADYNDGPDDEHGGDGCKGVHRECPLIFSIVPVEIPVAVSTGLLVGRLPPGLQGGSAWRARRAREAIRGNNTPADGW